MPGRVRAFPVSDAVSSAALEGLEGINLKYSPDFSPVATAIIRFSQVSTYTV